MLANKVIQHKKDSTYKLGGKTDLTKDGPNILRSDPFLQILILKLVKFTEIRFLRDGVVDGLLFSLEFTDPLL